MKPKYKRIGGAIWICPKGPSTRLGGWHKDGRKNTLRRVNGLVWKPAIFKQRGLTKSQKDWLLNEANARNFLTDRINEARAKGIYPFKDYYQFWLFRQFGGSFVREERVKGTDKIVTRRRSLGPKLLCPVFLLCDDNAWHFWKKEDFCMAQRRKKSGNPGIQPKRYKPQP